LCWKKYLKVKLTQDDVNNEAAAAAVVVSRKRFRLRHAISPTSYKMTMWGDHVLRHFLDETIRSKK